MSAKKRMPRLHYEIRRDEFGWGFFDPTGKLQTRRFRKKDVVDVAEDALTDAYTRCGVLSELRIKNRDGEVADARTYGEDPRRTKG